MWKSGRQTARDTSRCRARRWVVLDSSWLVDQGSASRGTEGNEQSFRESVEKDLELDGGVLVTGPGEPDLGSQPGEGGADHAGAHSVAPAPEGAAGDGRLSRAGEGDPLVGRLHAVTEDVHDRLEDGAYRRPTAPQLGGYE